MYRHPFYDVADFNNNNLIETVEKINHEKPIFYISRDFNIDYLKYNTCSKVSSYTNEIYSYGCKLLIDKPARITHSNVMVRLYTARPRPRPQRSETNGQNEIN